VLTVTVTNCGASSGCADGASTQDLGSVEFVVPDGLTVTDVSNFLGAQVWGSSWTSGQTVRVGADAPAEGTKKLEPGESITFDLTVTTTAVCGLQTFNTSLFAGSQDPLTDTTPGYNFTFYGPAPSVEITGCTVDEECPAAPSIAARYLHFDLGIHPNTDEYDNIVAAVAAEMGPGTDFQGSAKCDADYADKVRAFVDSLLP
jgi:hypothetical protein